MLTLLPGKQALADGAENTCSHALYTDGAIHFWRNTIGGRLASGCGDGMKLDDGGFATTAAKLLSFPLTGGGRSRAHNCTLRDDGPPRWLRLKRALWLRRHEQC